MKKNLIKLLVATSLSNFAYAETTNNLVSTDFSSGWTNTGNSTHGSSTIAGIHGGTVTSDSVSLTNDVGLNKNEINQGFTVNSSANVWFWNNYDQSVTMTTQAIDDNNQTITQTKTLSGTCATWNGCDFGSMTDTMVFNSNTQADYNLSLGFSFSVTDPTYQSGHYAADLKDPSMTITYTPINLDSTTETALLDLNKDIKEDLKDIDTFKFKEEPVSLTMNTTELQTNTEDMTFQDTFKDTESFDNKEDQTLESFQSEISNDQDSTSEKSTTVDKEMSIETNKEEKEESLQTTETTEDNEQTKDSENNETSSQATNVESKKDLSLNKTMQKIDAQVKDIGTNLGLKNLVKLKAMNNNAVLLDYTNKIFYPEKRIYEDQANIRDNRVLYANTSLVSYTQNDPIFTKEKELFTINLEKEKLQKEIEVLKNGF